MIRNCLVCLVLFIAGCAVLLIAGCGTGPARESARQLSSAEMSLAQTAEAPTHGNKNEGVASSSTGTDRKIIYEAQVQLVVRDFSAMESAMPRLVKENGGYLANVSVDRSSGERRFGRWVARIPVDQFETFLDAVERLGVPENFNQTAQDVTEEFVDLGARITNKKRLEERILKLLDETEGKISEVIEVERELARVRGEIEEMEGRLKYLANRTDLTTVVVIAREERDYVPPESPALMARIRRAWGSSLVSLRTAGENLSVAAVFIFPWTVVLVIVGAPTFWCVRRCRPSGDQAANNRQPRGPTSPE